VLTEASGRSRRRPWCEGPEPDAPAESWLSLDDDRLLYEIKALEAAPEHDQPLLEVVRSNRHFFIRQEAAKKITQKELLKAYFDDRHIGQILVRGLTRQEDVDYLEKLITGTRYIEVRRAASAQLVELRKKL
jgi:hypothetical protein